MTDVRTFETHFIRSIRRSRPNNIMHEPLDCSPCNLQRRHGGTKTKTAEVRETSTDSTFESVCLSNFQSTTPTLYAHNTTSRLIYTPLWGKFSQNTKSPMKKNRSVDTWEPGCCGPQSLHVSHTSKTHFIFGEKCAHFSALYYWIYWISSKGPRSCGH